MKHSPKDRAAMEAARLQRIQNPSTYELRHYGHRRAFATWWTCRQCSTIVAPGEGHGHLR